MQNLEEQLHVANWFYYLGEPVLSDKKYNEYFQMLRKENPDSPIVTKTWSEFDEPTDLLKKYNMLELSEEIKTRFKNQGKQDLTFLPKTNLELRNKYYSEAKEYFKSETLKSIDTISSLEDSDYWLKTLQEQLTPPLKFNISYKADGFNIPNYYVNGYYIGSHTRGRTGNFDDVTIAMSKVLPLKIDTDAKFLVVITEATCPHANLVIARELEPSKDLKSARSAVKTLLTTNSGDKLHKLLLPLVLNIRGMDFESKTHMLTWAELNGFTAVDNESVEVEDTGELMNIIKRMSLTETVYATDGTVVALDSVSDYYRFDTTGKYDTAIKAYRLLDWSATIYCSYVEDIVHLYSAHHITLQIQILPTRTAMGYDIGSLNCNNPRRVINTNLKQGSLVVFQHKHGSYPELLDLDTVLLNESANGFAKTPAHLIQPLLELHHRIKNATEKQENDSIEQQE